MMMAESDQGFEGGQLGTATATPTSTTSFSQLLFGGDDDVVGLDLGRSFCSTFPSRDVKLPGGQGHQNKDAEPATNTTKTAITTPQRSGITCSDSSSPSSGNNSKYVKAPIKPNRMRKDGRESAQSTGAIVTVQPAASQRARASKKSKVENPSGSTRHAKVRKEKVGDRISALKQLVSPFGKTDTASVLHEAMGYIRFLHDQVHVLCSPYLQHHFPYGEGTRRDLKSRGLCLVPLDCTVHVANSNGADFWSPAMGNYFTEQ